MGVDREFNDGERSRLIQLCKTKKKSQKEIKGTQS